MATIRVGDYIAEFLEGKGVDCAFMLSGGGMMHLQDALSRRTKLKYVCNHHEQACTFAAEAYGRQRESIGVCYATSGPGAANTITGIISAYQDSSPLIIIAGQAKVADTIRGTGQPGLRQLGTFEIDMVPIVQSVTKYAVFLDDPKMVRFHLEKAYHLATTGRPGPVYFEVPVDVQGALIDPATLRAWDETPPVVPVATQAEVAGVLDVLLGAERPLIFAGHGIRCAKEVAGFVRLVETLGIPVITTPMAADLIPHDHPLYIGHLGVKGDRAGNFSIQTADAVLMIGSSVRAQMTGYELAEFAPAARLMHEWNAIELGVTAHPLAAFAPALWPADRPSRARAADAPRGFDAACALAEKKGKRVRVTGLMAAARRVPTKDGKRMYFLTLDDGTGLIECTLFPDVYGRCAAELSGSGPYVVEGTVESQYGEITVTATSCRQLSAAEAGRESAAGGARRAERAQEPASRYGTG